MRLRNINTTRWIAAGLAIATVILLVGITTTLYKRFDAMEQRILTMAERVDMSTQHARAAAEDAGRSAAAATEARKQREAADTARSLALQEKSEAEIAAQQAAQEAQVARAEMAEVRKQREEELNRMQQALDRIVETRRTAFGMVMNLPESALRFDFNSATLRPEGREVLSRIAGILLASDSFGLAVHGHTDSTGSEEYNLRLSERRAEAVKKYMASAGIDPAIITVRGYGKSSPMVPPGEQGAPAKNRRVEIALTDTTIQVTGESTAN